MDNELKHYGAMGMSWGKDTKPEDSLEHFGKLGMKWGHRTGGAATSKPSASKRDELKKSNAKFQKDMADLQKSGKGNDVNAVIKRSKALDNEQAQIKSKYKSAASKNIVAPKTLKNGKTLSQNLLKDAGIVVASQVGGLAMMKSGQLTAGVVLASVGTYYGVGHAIVSTVQASKQ